MAEEQAQFGQMPTQAPAPAPLPVAAASAAAPVMPPGPGPVKPAPAKEHLPIDRSAPAGQPEKVAPASRRVIIVPCLVLLALMAIATGTWMFLQHSMSRQRAIAKPTIQPNVQAQLRENEYLEKGWQAEAKQVLGEFLAADSAAGKAAFSINGSELLLAMEQFYGPGRIDDSDTPLSGFAVEQLPPDDRKRGIFMMRYDQPPQFEMRDFFRPLAPVEVERGLEEPGMLLATLARADNFTSEPVKVNVFFKRTPDGLRLDWESFIQTKHRTFRSFTELANPGASGIFRLFVVEDVPEQGRDRTGMKTYRMVDPAHKTDSARVSVPVDSEAGRALSILNWRGVKDGRPKTRTATIELEWTKGAVPDLAVKRFICWEFLGIGGQAVETTRK